MSWINEGMKGLYLFLLQLGAASSGQQVGAKKPWAFFQSGRIVATLVWEFTFRNIVSPSCNLM